MSETDPDFPPSIIPQDPAVVTQPVVDAASIKFSSYFWDILETIVFALAIFVVVYLFIAQPHQVEGSSMYPNFISGEYILTNKLSYHFSMPQRGDVIVFHAPPQPDKDFIKRVIALPGETFQINNGHIYINGKPLPESYLPDGLPTLEENEFHNGEKITVPADNYIVLGDNRPQSSDSRDWGFVPSKAVIGKALLVYWPFQRFGLVPSTHY